MMRQATSIYGLMVLGLLVQGVACSASHAPDNGLGGIPGAPGGVSGAPNTNINPGSGVDVAPGDDVDAGDCGSILDVTYRDFDVRADFEGPFAGDVVRRRLIESMLGSDLKPIFKDSVGYPAAKTDSPLDIDETWRPLQPVIESADSFKVWYNTTPGVNIEFQKKLKLEESPPGSGIYGFESSAFFPLSPSEGFGITPKGNDQGMNFLFTTEIHAHFTYRPLQKFTFRGDDDLWIFVNGKLALDLGSMHGPTLGTIDFDAQAMALDISVGGTYAMDVFHAERHTRGSNFKITTNIACFTPGILK